MIKTSQLFILTTLLVLFDQITKFIVKGIDFLGIYVKGFYLGESIDFIGKYVTFTFVENPGMAWGIEFGAGKIFLSLFSVVASICLIWYLSKISFAHNGIRFGISLVLAGAAGNMIDRVFYGVIYNESPLFYGKVVDFLRVDIPDFLGMTHFPVFNIADSCVSIGIVLLILFNSKIPTFEEVKNGSYFVEEEIKDTEIHSDEFSKEV